VVLAYFTAIVSLVCSPIIILTWATLRYGERKHFNKALCASRSYSPSLGFVGSPDFYGLGIRVGIYLQWFASLAANAFLPGDRRSMVSAYAGFAIALLVAVLFLIFQHDCTYTAEMIILLNILWGGSLLVLTPYISKEFDFKDSGGLGLMFFPYYFPS
jgi:hypothetical protein